MSTELGELVEKNYTVKLNLDLPPKGIPLVKLEVWRKVTGGIGNRLG